MEVTKAPSRRSRRGKLAKLRNNPAARKHKDFPGGLVSNKQIIHEIQHKSGEEVKKTWNKFQHCIGKLGRYKNLQKAGTHIPSPAWKAAYAELKIVLRRAVDLGLGKMQEIRVHCLQQEIQYN